MRRRLATLATLVRLEDRRMRAAAAELQPLMDHVARLDAEAQELDRRRTLESTVTEVEAMPYLGRFLTVVRGEMDRILRERAGAVRAAEQKRDEVVEAWKDLRGKEQLRDGLLDRMRVDLARSEQAQADEQGGQAHWRRSTARQAGPQ